MYYKKEPYFPTTLSILLIFLSILFFIPDIIMYKMIKIGTIEESAAILFFPFVYSIADSITEVYGRKRTLIILTACYVISLLFSIVLKLVVNLPSFSNLQEQQAFHMIFDRGPWVIISGVIGVGASMYANVKLMSGLKKRMRGRHFILRSMVSSSIGELIVTGISYPLIFYSMKHVPIYLMINAYLFKLAYSIIGAFPARILVFLLREDGVKQKAFSEQFQSFTQQKSKTSM